MVAGTAVYPNILDNFKDICTFLNMVNGKGALTTMTLHIWTLLN